jgi:hypothetical protein
LHCTIQIFLDAFLAFIHRMPRNPINLDPYRKEIEHRLLVNHQSQAEICAWLERKGITLASRTLKRRCLKWGVTRYGLTSDPTAIARIKLQYPHASDGDIAATLSSQGLHLSAFQVRSVRLANGWQRRTAKKARRQARGAQSNAGIDQFLLKGAILWAIWDKVFQTKTLGGIVKELKQLMWMKGR